MKEKRKAKNRPRASRLWFVTGWLLIGIASLFIPSLIFSLLPSVPSASFWLYRLYWPLQILFLSGLQFLWLRRALGISLRLWAPLAVLGALLTALLSHLLSHLLWSIPTPILNNAIPDLMNILLLSNFLGYFVPLSFQWLALHRRFKKSWLWLLLAAGYAAMLNTHIQTSGSGNEVNTWTAGLLEGIAASLGITDTETLYLLRLLNQALGIALLGGALHYIITKSGDTVALRRGVETQEESETTEDHSRLALKEDEETMPAEEEILPGLAGARQLTSAP